MYVHPEKDLVYLAHPRTASRATKEALGQRGFRMIGAHHSGPPQHDLTGKKAFCVIRNHWDAICSWYYNWFNSTDKPLTAKWIRSYTGQNPNYFRPEGLWWYTWVEPTPVILRYETLQEDLDHFLENQGIKPIRLPVIGKTKGRPRPGWKTLHTAETVATVYEMWGHEIDRFGYTYLDESL